VNTKQFGCLLLAHLSLGLVTVNLRAAVVPTPYGISRQANVDASGQNIPGDAAKSLFENSVWSPAFRRRGAETA
jgi:hypothetical protein